MIKYDPILVCDSASVYKRKMSDTDVGVLTDTLESYVSRQLVAFEHEDAAALKKEGCTSVQNPGLKYMEMFACTIAESGSVVLQFENSRRHNNKIDDIMRVGDVVGVGSMSAMKRGADKKNAEAVGYVAKVFKASIKIVFDDVMPFDAMNSDTKYLIVKLDSHVTVKRMKNTLQRLLSFPYECQPVADLLFGSGLLLQTPIHPSILNSEQKLTFKFPLNPEQADAVEFALKQAHLAIIHGPPGTGKSTTLAELIYQLAGSGERVLVCAPSNVAVDHLMSRVSDGSLRVVRLGLPCRVDPANHRHTADAYIQRSACAEPLAAAKAELQETMTQLISASNPHKRRGLEADAARLRGEVYTRQNKLYHEVLLDIQVCFVTLGSSYRENLSKYFEPEFFTTVIIDECSQGLDALCWMAISQARRCILAGDHLQLAPVVLSREAARLGLGTSLMQRALLRLGDPCYRTLRTQYRMHERIVQWVSTETYGGKLVAHETVAAHLLSDLPGVEHTEISASPLILWDTSGCNLRETSDSQRSFYNAGEAEIVVHLARELVQAGVAEMDIAIIAPYSGQVALVHSRLCAYQLDGVEVKTVDGFQGREKEAVLLTLVRSNCRGSLGFLTDRRRLNVAASRARRLLCVVGDASTVCADPIFGSLIGHIREHGCVNSAHELSEEVTSRCFGGDQPTPPAKPEGTSPGQPWRIWMTVTQAQLQDIVSGHRDSWVVSVEEMASPQLLLRLSIEIEKMGLNKTLKGGFITVWKPRVLGESLAPIEVPFEVAKLENHVEERKEIHTDEQVELPCAAKGTTRKKKKVVAEVPEDPIGSLTEACQLLHIGNEGAEDAVVQEPLHKKRNKKKNLPVLEEAASRNEESESKGRVDQMEDEFLDEQVKLRKRCASVNCKMSVQLIGHDCPLCMRRFCIPHTLPEVHGCTENAKKAARKEFRHPIPKPLGSEKRNILIKALEKQMLAKSKLRKRAK